MLQRHLKMGEREKKEGKNEEENRSKNTEKTTFVGKMNEKCSFCVFHANEKKTAWKKQRGENVKILEKWAKT